jgi:hypothetical protein
VLAAHGTATIEFEAEESDFCCCSSFWIDTIIGRIKFNV